MEQAALAKKKTRYTTHGDKTIRKGKANGNGANLGFEEKLWQTADKLRGHLDPAEYKHVVLGLVFLKYSCEARTLGEMRDGRLPKLMSGTVRVLSTRSDPN